MGTFAYTALDERGKTRSGIIESDSVRQARQLLRDKSWSPLQVDASVSQQQRSGVIGFRRPSIGSKDLSIITRQLSTLIASGLPIDESIQAVAEQNESRKIVELLLAVRAKILEGHTLAASMGAFPKAFTSLYRSTIASGEKAGHLDLVLNRLADYTEARHESRQKVQLAMLYPVILFVLSLLIVGGLLAYVVPEIVTVFTDTGQELPGLTRGLIATSDFVASYGVFFLIAIVFAILVLKKTLRNDKFKLRYDRFILKLPLLKKLGYGLDTARFASTLSILSRSGVVLVEAMQIATAVIDNSYIRLRVNEATQKVIEGSSLRASLAQTQCFPPMMLHMIGSGEKSGELDAMLERTAHNQEKELENYITVLVRLFEPLMLVVMGVVVMLIVLAILLPILNLNQLVS